MNPTDLVARRLSSARSTGVPIAPVRDVLAADVDAAYDVQEAVVASRVTATNARVGRKVGLTSPAVQAQLGVDQPDFGVLLADMRVSDGATTADATLIEPRIEAEVAFVLGRAVTDPSQRFVADSVAQVVPALEIVDSRIARWDITLVDTVADNASSALFVLGAGSRPLDEVDTAGVVMELTADGVPVSHGSGADCLGDPLLALMWVARKAIELGRPLQAGEIVLSGALGPMVPFTPGVLYEARIAGLGDVRVRREGADR